jgi:hypothetical protein
MRRRGMATGYTQGLCFIPGAKVGPVPVIERLFCCLAKKPDCGRLISLLTEAAQMTQNKEKM